MDCERGDGSKMSPAHLSTSGPTENSHISLRSLVTLKSTQLPCVWIEGRWTFLQGFITLCVCACVNKHSCVFFYHLARWKKDFETLMMWIVTGNLISSLIRSNDLTNGFRRNPNIKCPLKWNSHLDLCSDHFHCCGVSLCTSTGPLLAIRHWSIFLLICG